MEGDDRQKSPLNSIPNHADLPNAVPGAAAGAAVGDPNKSISGGSVITDKVANPYRQYHHLINAQLQMSADEEGTYDFESSVDRKKPLSWSDARKGVRNDLYRKALKEAEGKPTRVGQASTKQFIGVAELQSDVSGAQDSQEKEMKERPYTVTVSHENISEVFRYNTHQATRFLPVFSSEMAKFHRRQLHTLVLRHVAMATVRFGQVAENRRQMVSDIGDLNVEGT